MSHKALHDLNPHQSDEYSSRNAQASGEKQHQTHEGRMNSKPSGQHSYKRRHEESKSIPDADADAFALKRQRRSCDVYEGRMNSKPSGEKQQHDYQRSHEGRMNAEPSVEEEPLYYPARGHDHSKCLLAQKQLLEPPPNFHPYLFLTEEERSLPLPSNKRKLDIVLDDADDDDWPVFDEDRYEESMLKLVDYMMKVTAKEIGKDHQPLRPQLPI